MLCDKILVSDSLTLVQNQIDRHRNQPKRRQNHSRSGRRSKSSMTVSELEFSSISTDSGTEMPSPPYGTAYSNQAYVRSRSPSLSRL